MNRLSRRELLFVSFMLFSMFFGAGNLIFPPFLGFNAGEQVWPALAGFVLSAVGLPILGVVAIARVGSFQALAQRVHPLFAFLFPLIIYVSIGPGLAIPRAGSLSFEMGAGQFLPQEMATHPLALLLYTVVFFGIVFWLSMSPSKLVDRFGKLLTPLLLTLIGLVLVKSWFTPLGEAGAAAETYASGAVVQGFLDGYQTMDALAALAFGIVIANTLRAKGVESTQQLSAYSITAGLGAGTLLAVIYVILGSLGATASAGMQAENGAQVLTHLMDQLFGAGGTVILGVLFTIACLCVSIGLVTSCSQFFAGALPWLSYQSWVKVLSVLSMLIANLGLTQILQVSVPILGAIYPLAIVLIVLGLLDRVVARMPQVYVWTIGLTGAFSVVDLINQSFLDKAWSDWLSALPFYAEGLGWLVPAVVGLAAGMVLSVGQVRRVEKSV